MDKLTLSILTGIIDNIFTIHEELKNEIIAYILSKISIEDILANVDIPDLLLELDTDDELIVHINNSYSKIDKIDHINAIKLNSMTVFNSDLLFTKQKLEYLKDHISDITLEDLETIRFNKK